MRALPLILLAAAACNEGALNLCTVDRQVDAQVFRRDPVRDCGNFTRGDVNYTDEAMLSAQQCVLNAVVNKQTFRFVYDANATGGRADSGLRAAFVGLSGEEGLRITSLAGSNASDMASPYDFVSGQPCATLTATPSCKARIGVPCLTCMATEPSTGSIICRGS